MPSPGPKINTSLDQVMDISNRMGLFLPNNPMGIQDISAAQNFPTVDRPATLQQPSLSAQQQKSLDIYNMEKTQKKQEKFNTAMTMGLGALSFIDHIIPEQKSKNPVIRPLPTYNPTPYGTGSEAIAKNGIKLKAEAGISLTEDPKPKKKPFSFVDELKTLSTKKLDGTSSFQLVKKAADQVKINPSLLYSSAYVEGMNQNLVDTRPAQSQAYVNAMKGVYTDFSGKRTLGKQDKINDQLYPVDGYSAYGLDTFGQRFDEFVKKGYLPAEFKDQFIPYTASNEKEKVTTAAFKSNEAALMAKAAYLRSTQDDALNYAKKKNYQLDPEAQDFFTMAYYNSPGSAPKMMDEYMSAKDKKAYLQKGLTKYKSVWNNIHQRAELMPLVDEYINSNMKYGGKMKGKKCGNGTKLMEDQSYDLDAQTINELLNAGYELDFE